MGMTVCRLGFTLRIVSGFGLFAAICLIVPFLEYGGSTAGLVLTLASIASIGALLCVQLLA